MRSTGMPILGHGEMLPIPWDVILPHEAQAQINHGQALRMLARRGGLDVSEAVAVLEDRLWRRMDETGAIVRLAELVRKAGEYPHGA